MKKRPKIEKKSATGISRRKSKLSRRKRGERRPDFETLTAADVENPLDELGDTLGLEGDADQEISAALQAVLDERAERKDEFRIGRSRRYYTILCFQCEDQLKEFLDAMGWPQERFQNGLEIAHSLGVEIEPINLPMRKYKKTTPKLLRKQGVIK